MKRTVRKAKEEEPERYETLSDEERILRKLLFMSHGASGHHLYGDDGELQCNSCMIDFKRDSVESIALKTNKYYMREYIEANPGCIKLGNTQ